MIVRNEFHRERGAVPLPLREGLGEGGINNPAVSFHGWTPHLTSPARGEELGRRVPKGIP